MKNNTLLWIGAAIAAYMILSRQSIGAQRGYVIRKAIDTRPGCHQGEVASFIKKSV